MNLSYPFIKRPVMTTMLMIAILLFGLICFHKLPVSDLPNVEYPTIVVTAAVPGADPEYMATSVALPLEQAFSAINGLNAMTSSNTNSVTEIVLNFDLNRNLDAAEVEVQGAISKTLPVLPPMPNNPTFHRSNPSQSPILYLTLSSDSQPLDKLFEYANNLILPPLSMINGIAEVLIYGHPYAVRVQADPKILYSRNLDFNSFANLLIQANPNLPGGNMIGKYQELLIKPFGILTSGKEYNEVILKQQNGTTVRLKEIAKAVNALQGRDPFFHLVTKEGTHDAVMIAVKRQADANTIAVTKEIYKKLPILQQSLPGSMLLETFYDRSALIQASVHEVELTFLLSFALIIAVIVLYLGKIKEALIPAVVLPLSIIGTFVVMYLAGFTIDNLSLLALLLAMGFIVDDAIVVLENIVRYLERGKTPIQAAFEGSKQISTTVFTMTIALATVFIPTVAMPGMLGRVFREFSITIIVAILLSGVISLTLIPMLCRFFLKQHTKKKVSFSEKINEKLVSVYINLLHKVLAFRKSALCIAAGCFAFSFALLAILPFDFFPTGDTGLISGLTQAQQGSSTMNTNQHQAIVDEVIAKNPHVASFLSVTRSPTSDQGILFIRLKDEKKRPKIKTVVASVLDELKEIPGFNTYLMPIPTIRLQTGHSGGLGQYQFTLSGLNAEQVYTGAKTLLQHLQQLPEIIGVNSDMKIDSPQLNFHILRDQAGIYGVTPQDIESTLQFAFSEGRISTFNLNQNLYDLILEASHPYQYSTRNLDHLYVKSSETDALVPLSSLARWEKVLAPSAVNHLNQLPAVTISFNLADSTSLGDALAKIEKISKEHLPPTVMGVFTGEADVFVQTFASMKWLMLLAVIIIYLILGILYESFLHPLTVLSALPIAGFGALLTLLLFGQTLSLYGIFGILVLTGLVQKNGIMLIDYAVEDLRKSNSTPETAIIEACKARFRPIIMTTLAAMMGVLPIVFEMGAAGRETLGLTIVGGLLFSQALTLFITPVVFLTLAKFKPAFLRKES